MHRSTISFFLILCIVFSSFTFAFAEDVPAEGAADALPVIAAEPAAEGFARIYAYADQFRDVDDADWYYQHVTDAYEYGLIAGRSESSYVIARLRRSRGDLFYELIYREQQRRFRKRVPVCTVAQVP